MTEALKPELVERVLSKLGFSKPPACDKQGLDAMYEAWCSNVPFDNVRKLIHVHSNAASPLPGDTPDDFWEAWLCHGTGGTCWAANGALQALLKGVGFDAIRGVATMMVAPDLPPNHGTVIVNCGGINYLTDASILHVQPIPIDGDDEFVVLNKAWGVRNFRRDGHRITLWRPMNRTEGLECKINYFPAVAGEFSQRHESTREWSPFNFELSARKNKDNRVVGAAAGLRVEIGSKGEVLQAPMTHKDRIRFLIEEIGISEELASKLPEDRKTPPPPGTRTAAAASTQQ